jgi:hypothetical protein
VRIAPIPVPGDPGWSPWRVRDFLGRVVLLRALRLRGAMSTSVDRRRITQI